MLLLSSLFLAVRYPKTVTCHHHTMKFSLQFVTAVMLAGSAVADRTVSDGNRRLDTSEAVTFQPNIGPCIDLPAGQADGTTNDGWSLAMSNPHNDNDVSAPSDLGFPFSFFGDAYGLGATTPNDKFRIFNNGLMRVGNPVFIAPFFSNVDTSGDRGHVWVKNFSAGFSRNVLAVTYENVGYSGQPPEDDRSNSFQVLLSDGNDAAMGVGNNICFCYENMEWTDGDSTVSVLSGGNQAGIGKFDGPGTDYGGPTASSSGVDYLDNKSFCFDARSSGSIPPIASGFPAGNDVITLDTCGTLSRTVSFINPSRFGVMGQAIDVTVLGAPDGFSTSFSHPSQDVTDIDIQFTPTLAGTYDVTFVATVDAGTPTERTTTVKLTIVVSVCPCGGNPVPFVDAGGPYLIFVEGGTNDILNGNLKGAATGANALTTSWRTDCFDGSSVGDETSPTADLIFQAGTEPKVCTATFTATDDCSLASASATAMVSKCTPAPAIVIPLFPR
jgi:hypothetical protein